MDVSFNTYNALKGRYIYVGGNGNVTQNAFSDSTVIGAFGTQTTKRVNVDGSFMLLLMPELESRCGTENS